MSLSSSDNFAGDERSDFFSESNSSLGEGEHAVKSLVVLGGGGQAIRPR